jgi:thymidylate synthase
MAYPTNVYGLNELLKFVGKETNLDCGKITTVSSSLHSYERNFKDLLKIIYPYDRAMLEYGLLRRRTKLIECGDLIA